MRGRAGELEAASSLSLFPSLPPLEEKGGQQGTSCEERRHLVEAEIGPSFSHQVLVLLPLLGVAGSLINSPARQQLLLQLSLQILLPESLKPSD